MTSNVLHNISRWSSFNVTPIFETEMLHIVIMLFYSIFLKLNPGRVVYILKNLLLHKTAKPHTEWGYCFVLFVTKMGWSRWHNIHYTFMLKSVCITMISEIERDKLLIGFHVRKRGLKPKEHIFDEKGHCKRLHLLMHRFDVGMPCMWQWYAGVVDSGLERCTDK